MINAITGWIFGDIEHLDPAEASALTITKQDMICIAKSVLVASVIMAIVMTPVVISLSLSI
jgi:ABC-type phosphate transport system permease subunit